MATEFSNGTTIPHADGWDDLLDKLKTFLTTNVDLVADTQAWTVESDTVVGDERFVYLNGPGLASVDEIRVNIRRYSNVPTSAYNWEIRGSTGYDSALEYTTQPGVSYAQYFPLVGAGNNIQYWFFANGRRFIIVAKIGAVYLSCYCGFFLPYALPSEYPYPLLIACGGETENGSYNTGTDAVTGFFNPKTTDIIDQDLGSNCYRTPGGLWERILNETLSSDDTVRGSKLWPNNIQNGAGGSTPGNFGGDFPDNGVDSFNIGANKDGSYTTLPFLIYSTKSGGNLYGELDGVLWVSGVNNTPENTLTIGTDTYVCHQSANQSNIDEFAAFHII